MDSIWYKDIEINQFPKLQKDIRTDVAIIGGGMAGLLCAYQLRKVGTDCLVIEADRICAGVTGSTTAKITLQHGLIYHKLIQKFGVETAQGYYLAQNAALTNYKDICMNIPCDFEEKSSVVYSCIDRKALEAETAALERIGCNAAFLEELQLPLDTVGGVQVNGQAQFHPLKFASAIANDLKILEHTRVLEIRKDCLITNKGNIKADKVIVTTHFPFLNKHGMYFMKLYQDRSYVLALKNAQDVGGMYVDADKKGMSFRNFGEMLLLGGGSHRTGKAGGCWQELERFCSAHYPNAQIITKWATQDCMTLDGMPYIGLYSNRTPNLYVATGFNKWGMTSAMVSATVLCDLIQGKKNDFAHIFEPARSILQPQLASNIFESVKGLLTPTAPRCPHMGCALKFNKQEHSWDCSCHGSRFGEDGKLLDNPATGDKKC